MKTKNNNNTNGLKGQHRLAQGITLGYGTCWRIVRVEMSGDGQPNIRTKRMIRFLGRMIGVIPCVWQAGVRTTIAILNNLLTPAVSDGNRFTHPAHIVQPGSHRGLRSASPSQLGSHSLYPSFNVEMMIDESKNSLKGQHRLAQGFGVSAQSNGNVLGYGTCWRIVRVEMSGDGQPNIRTKRMIRFLGRMIGVIPCVWQAGVRTTIAILNNLLTPAVSDGNRFTHPAHIVQPGSHRGLRSASPSQLGSHSLYPSFNVEMMIDESKNSLKGQQRLDQGKRSCAVRLSSHRSLGLESGPDNRTRENVHKRENLISYEPDDLVSQGTSVLRFRPKGIICFAHRILADGFSTASYTQGGVSVRSSRNFTLGYAIMGFQPAHI